MSALSPVTFLDPLALATTLLGLTIPFACVMTALAVGASLSQGSLTVSASRLLPQGTPLDLVGGIRRLHDPAGLLGGFRGVLVRVGAIVVAARLVLRAAIDGARATGNVEGAATAAAADARNACTTIGLIAVAFALVDLAISRKLWLSRLRMTREEVVRERKNEDGSDALKRHRADLHRALPEADAIALVRTFERATTLVVRGAPLFVFTLHYEPHRDVRDRAPRLVARGQGALAKRMLDAANDQGVTVVGDAPLARALMPLDVGDEIPPALYEAVAIHLRDVVARDPEE
ncbi:MAG: hypothetical protein NVSMB1_23140 [Polyangiales bacterium]